LTDGRLQAEVYDIKGPGWGITYRPRDGELTIESEEWSQLSGDKLDHDVTVVPGVGMLITAVLLDSSRNGTRLTLTVLLPEASWEPSRVRRHADVTGVATVTGDFTNLVGGPPPVLQKYEPVLPLEGTAWS
jgi:hypothetical protein